MGWIENYIVNLATPLVILLGVFWSVHKGWLYTGTAFGLMRDRAEKSEQRELDAVEKLEGLNERMNRAQADEREVLIAEIAALREQIRGMQAGQHGEGR